MGRWRYDTLCKAPTHALWTIFAQGKKPRFEDLVGWDLRGYSPPTMNRLLGIQRFIKGFYQLAGDPPPEKASRIYGYNIGCSPFAPASEWRSLPDESSPRRHGFYDVYEHSGKKFKNALIIDYGVPENHGLNPERFLLDYLVQVDPDDPSIFLGTGNVKLGPALIFSNFFILEKLRQHHYRP
jgi:hypothetical protein